MIPEATGEGSEREGLFKTPGRVSRMYAGVTAGYHVDPEWLINDQEALHPHRFKTGQAIRAEFFEHIGLKPVSF